MIGQEKLWEQIEKQEFPRFAIFVGDKGSGRKTFVAHIWKNKLSIDGTGSYTLPDIKIEDVRKMVTTAYKVHNYLFCIPDADGMSIAARNAMLKVVEECPNDNYFVMTLEDEYNTLDTIRSRAVIYHMDRYTPAQIKQYAGGQEQGIEVCSTPGEYDILSKNNIKEFYDYVETVIDNIAEVSGANSFKIADKVGMKGEEDKYDLKLFWKIFSKLCIERAIKCFENNQDKEGIRYVLGARNTSKILQGLRVKGINRQMLFDMWILDMRREWM